MKVCVRCKIEKDDLEFHPRGNKFQSYCKPCSCEVSRAENKSTKIEAFEHYGGCRCVCCSIIEPTFLALDHEDNDGAKHRKEVGGSGTRLYRWLKARGWPDLRLRVLCHNCNIGRQINGICPHQVLLPDRVTGNSLGSEPRNLGPNPSQATSLV